MPDGRQLASLINFGMAYYTTQLVRCAAFSFMLIGLVMLLRKILFSERTFCRGMSWAVFLIIPFLGKLKIFYENEAVLRATWRITAVTVSWLWVDRIYMAGILVTAICIFGKRLHLQRNVDGMEKAVFENIHVYLTDMNITPFTVGMLKPKIVLPEVMADSYSVEELKAVVRHEQTHIRLGHLWFGFAWDILRCLLWINPFLTVFQKHFREDMEDICDRVCIQSSGSTAHEYGLMLLKSLKLLCSGQEDVPPAATYAGEKGFADMKRRMEEIAGFRPYRKWLCRSMAGVGFLIITVILMAVHMHSYARCNESRDILVGKYDGENEVVSCDTEELSRMISYDDEYVYVEREAFEEFLIEKMQNDSEKEKDMKDMIKGVESMSKLAEGMAKATGWTIVYQHSYIDENGKYHCRMQTRNDGMLKMSAKLREERKKISEKLFEKAKEKAAERKEKLEETEDAGKTTVKDQPQVGANLDLKI